MIAPAAARRLRRALDRHGLRGTAREAGRLLGGVHARRRVVRLERAFDREYGVDTAGIVRLHDLAIDSANKELGVRYEGILPAAFHPLLDGCGVEAGDMTFIDLGAGKGRALLLASLYPFRRVVGVEFSAELAEIAARNAERFCSPAQRCRDIKVLCEDAAAFTPPPGPVLVYIFNAFDEPVMRAVVENLRRSAERDPRRVVLVLASAQSRVELLREHGFRPLGADATRFELATTVPVR